MRDASSSCPAPAGARVLAAKTAERKHPARKSAGTLAALLVAATLLPTACTTSAGEAQNDPLPAPSSKSRVLVLTDIENEPDDAQSLVRFLLYVNEMDVEGLLATTSVWMRDTTRADKIRGHIEAYREVHDNLLVHADGYPEADFLLSQVKTCRDVYGMNGVGEGNDTEGSEHIIATVDKEDDRPLWISVWGGANCLAQALWKVRETRTPEELDAFVAKLRVYTISDQDDSGSWMRQEFTNLFYVVTPSSPHDGDDYKYATWVGISGDHFHGMFEGPNFDIVDNPWLSENIRTGHGPLGARYPATAYLMEGDTPSFMNLFRNGLAGHISPGYGCWGGRYAVSQPEGESRPIWTNSDDTVLAFDGNTYTTNHATVWRWREGYQHDIAARADWSNTPDFAGANHNPMLVVNGDAGLDPLHIAAHIGETVPLSAEGSSDPDGNRLAFDWCIYTEASSYPGDVSIMNASSMEASLVVPENAVGTEIHVILTAYDDSEPALYRYRRVIVTVTKD